ncbi:hypothetical protein CLV35_2509 [Motilibacter peucedani]|uniref:Protein kinase domain-containing protein n=1 Tax=Motilibacter peucedani TaxID=598650 RepID=A0A420XP84_9ACTN|nr:hypothetical protein [Motilibacter peucedani]RKS74011.1 hypothetical protein CLV35_2509 [Motilibacter peucedani]
MQLRRRPHTPLSRQGADDDELMRRLRLARHEHLAPLRLVDDAAGGRRLSRAGVPPLALSDVLASRGTLRPGEVVTVLVPVARALAAVHEAGLATAGVGVGDVRLDRSGRPVLACVRCPTLLEPAAADADVRSLAVLAWHLLTGEDPGDEPLPAPVPRALAALVTSVLDAAPGRRPDAALLADELFAACAPAAVGLPPAEPGPPHATDEPRPVAEPGAVEPAGVDPVAALRFGLTPGTRAAETGAPSAGARRAATARAGRRRAPRPAPRKGARRAGSGPQRPDPQRPAARTQAARTQAARTQAARTRAARTSLLAGGRAAGFRGPAAGIAVALASCLVVLLVVRAQGLVPWAEAATRPPTASATGPAAATAAASPTATPATGVAVPAAASPAPSAPPQPADDWPAVLASLDLRRSAAFEAADPVALGVVYAPGAPAAARDRALLESYRAAGVRVLGLRTTTTAVTVQQPGADRVVLRVTDRLHGSLTRAGSPAQEVSRGSRTWQVELRRAAGEWRTWEVGATPGG